MKRVRENYKCLIPLQNAVKIYQYGYRGSDKYSLGFVLVLSLVGGSQSDAKEEFHSEAASIDPPDFGVTLEQQSQTVE